MDWTLYLLQLIINWPGCIWIILICLGEGQTWGKMKAHPFLTDLHQLLCIFFLSCFVGLFVCLPTFLQAGNRQSFPIKGHIPSGVMWSKDHYQQREGLLSCWPKIYTGFPPFCFYTQADITFPIFVQKSSHLLYMQNFTFNIPYLYA